MARRVRIVIAVVSCMGLAPALDAAKAPGRQAKVVDDLLSCRAITGASERLACFDRASGSLDTAAQRHDVVVVDREQVQQARQSLFGFALPRLSILGVGEKGDDDGPREVNAVVRSVRRDREGQWLLTLEDGAIWHQTDQTMLRHDPHPGSSAVIRRAALGTFFVRVDGQLGFRARRES